MYKLIIVDDEKRARDVVAKYIEKLALGYEIAGCFSDGCEALDFLGTNRVDVVITDIKMPKMGGLELVKNIYEKMPECKTIIISGYSEFEYAKKAIEYNVLNYILKPINVKELTQTLLILKKKFEQAAERKQNYLETTKILQEQFFADLLMGAMRKNEIDERFMVLGFPFDLKNSPGVFFSITVHNLEAFLDSKWKYGKEKLETVMLNIIQKSIKTEIAYQVSQKDACFTFIIIGNEIEKAADKELDVVKENIQKILRLDVHIIERYYFQNIVELSKKPLMIKNEREEIKLLISHIKSGDNVGAKRILNNMIVEDIKNGHKIEEFILRLNLSFKNSGLIERQARLIRVDEELINPNVALRLTEEILSSLHLEEKTGEDVVIKMAKTFINENCGRDLSRDDVAEHVYLNSAYFSRYFKQQTGESFYDYLISVRMRKAVELLLQNTKIYEIVEKVGYKSRKHFSKVFKEYTGYAPIEYKKNVLKMEGADDEDSE